MGGRHRGDPSPRHRPQASVARAAAARASVRRRRAVRGRDRRLEVRAARGDRGIPSGSPRASDRWRSFSTTCSGRTRPSWDTLEYLVPQLENERLLICLTIRAEETYGETLERRRRLSRNELLQRARDLSRLTRDELQAVDRGGLPSAGRRPRAAVVPVSPHGRESAVRRARCCARSSTKARSVHGRAVGMAAGHPSCAFRSASAT